MFDFFKDMYWELRGVDSAKLKVAKQEKLLEKKESRFIFSKAVKNIVIVLAVLYVVLSISLAVTGWGNKGSVMNVLMHISTSLIAIAVCACLIWGTKLGEIAALAGAFLFTLILYLTIVL